MTRFAGIQRLLRLVLATIVPPRSRKWVGLFATALAAGVFLIAVNCRRERENEPGQEKTERESSTGARTVVFCHWNLENLFDDKDDKRRQLDEDYDSWFVADPDARKRKYQRITEALLRLNNGIAPDIIVGNEIESYRAAELLKESLNARLPAGSQRFEYFAMKELDAGRHIAPCVISRFPISKTRLLGRRQRILEAHLQVNDHNLVIVVSHWTSHLSDKGEDLTRGRFAYANTIHEAYREAIHADQDVDFVVAGDFNDIPHSESVATNLRLTGNATLVTRDANPPRLFGPLTDKSPDSFGTHYFHRPLIYDQIGLSPGLLDQSGWTYVDDSVNVPTDGLIRAGSRTRRPWRFGSRNDDAAGRGFSDHFPVLATFQVAP